MAPVGTLLVSRSRSLDHATACLLPCQLSARPVDRPLQLALRTRWPSGDLSEAVAILSLTAWRTKRLAALLAPIVGNGHRVRR
jgi:hypothetical protein